MKKVILYLSIILFASSLHADDKRFSVPINDSPVTGPADAPVTIIEFLDFQ